MARDAAMERLVAADLAGLDRLRSTAMFGGMAWMWRGNLLCGARADGILFRLGKGNDAAALAHVAVAPMTMGERPMKGWVRLSPAGAQHDGLRRGLLAAARAFVETLPPK